MLKLFKYFLLGAAFLAAAACSDEGNGAGDATIGFEQATYSFRESEGTVRIPVKFTGEPKSYPITFDIVPSVDSEDGITVDSVARFIQLEHFRYIGDPDAPVYIEIDLLDNDFENESRFLTLTIASADGAEIVDGQTTIEIYDNDANMYDKLMGRWAVQSVNVDGGGSKNPTWITYVMDGFDEEEAAENRAANRLMCYGFGGYSDTPGGAQFIWYLNLEYDELSGETTVSVDMTEPLVDADEDIFGIGVNPTMLIFSTMPVSSASGDVDMETPLYGTVSGDGNTITFDPETALIPLVWSNGQYMDMYMTTLGNMVMTRAD